MELDTDKIGDAVLALLYLGLHDGARAWKGFDWDAMNRLHEQGLWVPAIRPPTVAPGTSRLRVTLCAAHTQHDVAQLAGALNQLELEQERTMA